MINKYPSGWVKDKPDRRDFPARKFVYAEVPLPTNYFVYPNTNIYNQGQEPACVGYSCAGVKTDEEFLQYHSKYLFDGLWLYRACKKVDGIPEIAGTYIRTAMGILQELGIRQIGTLCIKRQPDINWKIGAYFRIENDSEDHFIKQVIFQHGSIVVGSWWYASWYEVKDMFPQPFGKGGGHAWRICGWRNEAPSGWIVVNSWGKVWGKDGIAIMPYQMFRTYILEDGGDIWKLIDS